MSVRFRCKSHRCTFLHRRSLSSPHGHKTHTVALNPDSLRWIHKELCTRRQLSVEGREPHIVLTCYSEPLWNSLSSSCPSWYGCLPHAPVASGATSVSASTVISASTSTSLAFAALFTPPTGSTWRAGGSSSLSSRAWTSIWTRIPDGHHRLAHC